MLNRRKLYHMEAINDIFGVKTYSVEWLIPSKANVCVFEILSFDVLHSFKGFLFVKGDNVVIDHHIKDPSGTEILSLKEIHRNTKKLSYQRN